MSGPCRCSRSRNGRNVRKGVQVSGKADRNPLAGGGHRIPSKVSVPCGGRGA